MKQSIEIVINAFCENIKGFMLISNKVSEPLTLNDIAYLTDLLNERLIAISDISTADGYLTMGAARALNKEVKLIEKQLQIFNNISNINTL